jgi:ATP-dependent Clp protease ATP-binding subunit ClpA
MTVQVLRLLKSVAANVDSMKANLEMFFNENMEMLPEESEYVLQQTIGFQRVIQRAVNHVRSAEKKEVAVSDILASIFMEKDSHAVFFLNEEGISRLDVLRRTSPMKFPPDMDDDARRWPHRPNRKHPKKASPLEAYTVNLIDQAAKGKLDPLIGRELEMERTMQVLCRRRKNNPIFVGDPGVGKTAMAEGLAQRIWEAEVPDLLKEVRIYSLDLGACWPDRSSGAISNSASRVCPAELKKRKDAILFIDEIHTIVGAGATSSGSMDASNILKPFLSTGELRCIGSTTYEEYKNHFEKDRALSRRFEKIDIMEPPVNESIKILKGLRSRYEEHHEIEYTDAALKAACELSAKYINDRFLPDKAIDVIDEAGAAIRLSGAGNRKKIHPSDIEKIVAKIARIPAVNVSTPDKAKLENLGMNCGRSLRSGRRHRCPGDGHQALQGRPGPAGKTRRLVFCLPAPPVSARPKWPVRWPGLDVEFMRYDMSEYMEKHAVARLIGAPPGYIGFDQGGLLTDGVRKHPYCVLLLDEIEKAHEDLFNILLQVLDHATLTDNNGKKADFRNVIVMMTSNAGSGDEQRHHRFRRPQKAIPPARAKKPFEKYFSPEFRNRLDGIITFNALDREIMLLIVDKFMKEFADQLAVKKVPWNTTTENVRIYLAGKAMTPIRRPSTGPSHPDRDQRQAGR